jgi:hypothetical protein
MDIQACIDSMKIQLEEHETSYCHALAVGDWQACSFHKGRVTSLRAGIGRLVKQKLAARA